MSANPNRVVWAELPLPPAEPEFPLREGNRVVEALAQQQTLGALLAFSELHEQIQNRRCVGGPRADWDLLETERFVLDEVLQLICDRAQAITEAEGLIIALTEGSVLACRATSGRMAIERGKGLPESEFVRDCLDSGRVLRCDDCDVDGRVEQDISVELGARSTVLVPLRGRRTRIGVLQAFSRVPFAFGDNDVRALDLFAELILAALKPEDQDRRLNWLSEVADEILRPDLSPAQMPAQAASDETAAVIDEFACTAQLPAPADAEAQTGIEQSDDRSIVAAGVKPEPLSVPFLASLNLRSNPHPGLAFVIILVGIAALFSTGVYWGMHNHRSDAVSLAVTTRPAAPSPSAPVQNSNPPAAQVATNSTADNLLDSNKLDSEPLQASPASPAKLASLPKVTGVRHWSSQVGSTVVIDMQDQVPYEVHRLATPERIYFDLHDTGLASELQGKTIDIGDPSLKRVRVAQPVAGVTRIVLDTNDGSNFAVSLESNPYRIVVQLGSAKSTATARLNPPPAAEHSEARVALSPAPAKSEDDRVRAGSPNFRIVLDAGHGGWDLGTVGRQGLLEKDLVLDVTQRLGKLLQTRLGARVVYTRKDDTYLPLDQRAELANDGHADVFVSVHANYSNLASARGVETYYTNLFSAPGSREIETRADGTTPHPALIKLSASDLHEKIEESRRLASSVQRSLYAKLAANSPAIRDRGIKDSAFVVLTGTTMPAILTEISFVSSPADEKNLQTPTYRQQIAEALYKGIAQYEAGTHHTKMAQVRQSTDRQ